jgi:hypothetical protein
MTLQGGSWAKGRGPPEKTDPEKCSKYGIFLRRSAKMLYNQLLIKDIFYLWAVFKIGPGWTAWKDVPSGLDAIPGRANIKDPPCPVLLAFLNGALPPCEVVVGGKPCTAGRSRLP